MQRANDITIEAYRAAFTTMHEGMTNGELAKNISAAFQALGANGGAMAIFGKYTAFPHGSIAPQKLREGDFVLIDDGVSVEGYQSDITRTVIFGKPTDRQKFVWDLERKAQDAAFAAAQVGATCESVDAAARNVITKGGFGPGYKTPGLPHRTGHGIGLDGHEWTNFVKGNKTKIEPGMCFSDEPTIAIYGEFGVRLEDCMYITGNGPKMFTKQSPLSTSPSDEENNADHREFHARIEKAQQAMKEFGLGAIVLEPGPAMIYFSGVRWGKSERSFILVIPAKGEPAWVLPGFEEMRARELIQPNSDIRIWQEDESPYERVAQILKDRGVAAGRVGMDDAARFFVFDGVRRQAPKLDYVTATPALKSAGVDLSQPAGRGRKQ